jgi:hypothetical protein
MRARILVLVYVLVLVLPIAATVLRVPQPKIDGALVRPAKPSASVEGFLDESYQPDFVAWFTANLRLRRHALILENTLFRVLLGEAQHGADVVLGDDGVLFAPDDLEVYNRSAAELPSQDAIDAMADRIARVQLRLRERHQALVPILIPNKTTVYRESIPDRWTRELGDVRPNDRVYQQMKAALDIRHVTYVDARPIIDGEPRDRMWASAARHWSFYTACLSMREVMKSYAALTERPSPSYDCTLVLDPAATWHDDVDLWRLENALGPLPTKPVAGALHQPARTRDLKVLFVGSSFCITLVKDAEQSGVFGRMVLDFYNKTFMDFPSDVRTPVHPHTDPWRDIVLGNDLYVLDLYETFLPGSPDFLDELGAELH